MQIHGTIYICCTYCYCLELGASSRSKVEAGALDPIKTDLLGIQALGPCLRKRACSCINTDMIGSKGSGRSDCTFWKRPSTLVLG